MPGPAWSTQQLAEFLAVVSSAETEAAAARAAVERAAEALDAEVGAIVCGGELVAAVGYPEGPGRVAELESVSPGGAGCELAVPGRGVCPAAAVSLEHPPGATLVVARSGPDGLSPQEASLLRGMARVTSMTMRMLRLLDNERAAHERSDRHAVENARLLATLTERQELLERLAEEQAALRRVATLVGDESAAADVFAGVVEEAVRLLRGEAGALVRYEPDGTVAVVAGFGDAPIPVGTRVRLDGESVTTMVLRSGGPARVDSFEGLSGSIAEFVRQHGIRSSVGAPVVVDGRVWGALLASSTGAEPLPPDSEQRLAGFTELVGTAISNAQARGELAQLIQEQAALRRVATLVARAVPPEVVFATVTEEVARLVRAHHTVMVRSEAHRTPTVVAVWHVEGFRLPEDSGVGESVWRPVLDTGRPARIELQDSEALAGFAADSQSVGIRSVVGCPIVVEGRVWGAVFASSRKPEPFSEDTESRIMGFTDLVATAISNAASRAQLAASRARIVATADETRRRIERDLHDGIQQRLVTLGLDVHRLKEAVPPERQELLVQVSCVGDGLRDALDEVREISRGIHPAILSEGGLGPALKSLARRSAVPVQLDLRAVARLPAPVEAAAYYVVSEALANVAKHAHASVAHVDLEVRDETLHLSIRDDGVGGADPVQGSGILGLMDRVEALGGTIAVTSPPGEGTSIVLDLPIEFAPPVYVPRRGGDRSAPSPAR